MKSVHVYFTYFKDSGKYYSSGSLDIPYVAGVRPVLFHEALNNIRTRLNNGERPGLVDGFDFHVLVTVFTEFGPLSHLFVVHEPCSDCGNRFNNCECATFRQFAAEIFQPVTK